MKHFLISVTAAQAFDDVSFIAEFENKDEANKLFSAKYSVNVREIPITEQATPLSSEEAKEKVKNTVLHRYNYKLEPEGVIKNIKLPDGITVGEGNCLTINCDYKKAAANAEACKKEVELMSWVVNNFKAVYAGARNNFKLLDSVEIVEENTLQIKKSISHVFDNKDYVSVHIVTSIREIVEI